MLPKSWRIETFGQLLEDGVLSGIQDGNHGAIHPKASDYVPSGIPFVMARDLLNGTINYSGCSFIPNTLAKRLRIGHSRPGDVLISHKGTIGSVALVPDDFAEIMLTPQVTYYRVNEGSSLDRMFLFSYLRSHLFQSTFAALAQQSTRDYIGITAKLLANAESQKRALMQQLLTGKRRLKGFERKWKTVRLDEICDPKQWPTISKAEQTESGYPVFGANGQIGFYDQYNHEHETIVVTCRGATCGTVNMTPPRTYITGNAMSLDDVSSAANVSFLFQLLAARGFNDIISGSAQPQIIGKDIKAVTINLPALEEQKALAEMFEAWDKSVQNTGSQLDALKQEKSSLMQQLLTGKRRVKL